MSASHEGDVFIRGDDDGCAFWFLDQMETAQNGDSRRIRIPIELHMKDRRSSRHLTARYPVRPCWGVDTADDQAIQGVEGCRPSTWRVPDNKSEIISHDPCLAWDIWFPLTIKIILGHWYRDEVRIVNLF